MAGGRQHQYHGRQHQYHGENDLSGMPPGNRNQAVSPLEELMRRKGVDDAWAALEEMQKQGLTSDRFTVSRMLMKTVGDGRNRVNPTKVYRGIALVERFIQYQPEEADEVLFNALLDTCCRIKDMSRLDITVHRMQELQVPPSHVTLGILVKSYGQAGDINRVLKVWEDMHDQRRQANAVTYGCMIDACVKCGHMQKAMEIFHDMKRRRKHRNTILYTTLIKGCGLEKDIRTALTLFREMRDEGVPYNTITYNSIIDVCIKCSDVQTAEELLREMLAPGNNIEPDLITYSTLLKGYCHVGDLDKALQVAETIKACGLKCDELVYNTLMDGCVKANDLSAGIGLFAEMTQAGMKPSSITHSILVRLYQRNGYMGDCFDAVALLYQHHGLERPSGTGERNGGGGGGGKGYKEGRRGDRNRNGNQNHNHRGGGGGGGGEHHSGPAHSRDQLGHQIPPNMPQHPGIHFPDSMAMPPHLPGNYGAAAPPPMYFGHDSNGAGPIGEGDIDHSAVLHAQNLAGMSYMSPPGAPPLLPPNSHLDVDRGMYMPHSDNSRGMMGTIPAGPEWPYGMNGLPPHLTGAMLAPPPPHPGAAGSDPRRRGRFGDNGPDASQRMGAAMPDLSTIPPWIGDGNLAYPMMPGPKAYGMERMPGMMDGHPPLVGLAPDYPLY